MNTETALVCIALKKHHELELKRLELELEESRKGHTEDLVKVLEHMIISCRFYISSFPWVISHWNVLPDPRPVLEACLTRPCHDREIWVAHLIATIQDIDTSRPQVKDFVTKALEVLAVR